MTLWFSGAQTMLIRTFSSRLFRPLDIYVQYLKYWHVAIENTDSTGHAASYCVIPLLSVTEPDYLSKGNMKSRESGKRGSGEGGKGSKFGF